MSALVTARVDTSSSITQANALRTSRSAIDAVFAALQRHLRVDAVLPIQTRVTPPPPYLGMDVFGNHCCKAAPVDMSDADYYAK